MTPRPRNDDRGVATVWTIVIAAACAAMVGLVIDGGTLLRARSTSFDLAGGAARAGAQQLDQAALAQGTVQVNPDAAVAAAEHWLAQRDAAGTATVQGDTVTVTVTGDVPLQILTHLDLTVTETATAQAERQ